MLDGIKLLIDRMEHHPEEFFGDLAYRWADIMQDIAKHGPEYLEEDDLMLLNKKVKEVRRKELNAKILDEIASQQRLNTAQERFSKSGKIDTTPYLTGSAIPKPQGQQKVWWSGNVPDRWSGNTPDPSYDPNSQAYFGKSVLDMIERGGDIATVQNIRATNKALEAELESVKKDIARRDEERSKAQAYKKRNNQNWK
jgi:hypothetical protein